MQYINWSFIVFPCRKYNGEGYLDYRDNFDVYNSSWGDYSTTIFTQRAKEIIETYGERTKPMFLFLSHQAPHNPLDVRLQSLSWIERPTHRVLIFLGKPQSHGSS